MGDLAHLVYSAETLGKRYPSLRDADPAHLAPLVHTIFDKFVDCLVDSPPSGIETIIGGKPIGKDYTNLERLPKDQYTVIIDGKAVPFGLFGPPLMKQRLGGYNPLEIRMEGDRQASSKLLQMLTDYVQQNYKALRKAATERVKRSIRGWHGSEHARDNVLLKLYGIPQGWARKNAERNISD